jgi:LysM repeat protein
VYGGPQTARVVGTVGGRRVNLSIDRSDGCGIADWDKLRALLGKPERRGRVPRPARSTVATTTAPPVTYTVSRGDTLTKIARQFHTSVPAIVQENHLTDPDHLSEGQKLLMPPPSAVRIDAKLLDGNTGSGFGLTLVGAQPSELVTFQIVLPDGSTYTGSPHAASTFGVATATYSADIGSGTYKILATGTAGTNSETSFHVVPGGK